MYILSAEEFNKHSSVWMRVLKAAPLSRYKESFVPQINTSNVPFCCIKAWKVRAPLPTGMAKCIGGHGAAGNLFVPGHCLTDSVKQHSHWMGWAFSHQPSWLECTPTKRLFSTSNHFIRSLSGQLRAGSLAATSSLCCFQWAVCNVASVTQWGHPLSSCRWSLPVPQGQTSEKGVALTVHPLQALSVD